MRNFLSNFSNKTMYFLFLIGSLQTLFSQENNSIHWLSFEQAVELQAQEGNSKKFSLMFILIGVGGVKKWIKIPFRIQK